MAVTTSPPAAAEPQHRRRRRVVLLGLLLVALVALAVVVALALRVRAPSPVEQTVWQAITAGITDGAVPKNVALEAFADDYAVSIPGVQLPAGRGNDGAPSDGSGPLRWVLNHWSELTPDQQAVIDRYIEPGPNDDVITFSLPGQGNTTRLATGVPHARLAEDSPMHDAIVADLTADLERLGPKLGLPTIETGGTIDTLRPPSSAC